MSNDSLNWITPQALIGEDNDVTDRLVINDRYLEFKEAVIKSFQEKRSTLIEEVISKCLYNWRPYLLMAMYQNVTILHRNIENMTSQILEIFQPIDDKYFENDKQLTKSLFHNTFTHNLKVSKDTWHHIDLSMLLVELKFSVLFSSSNLIAALKDMITNAGDLWERYLPTMPHDTYYEIKMTLMSGTTTQFYSCPNGKLYLLLR